LRTRVPCPMRLRMPITERSISAPIRMQPSETSAPRSAQPSTLVAGRKARVGVDGMHRVVDSRRGDIGSHSCRLASKYEPIVPTSSQ